MFRIQFSLLCFLSIDSPFFIFLRSMTQLLFLFFVNLSFTSFKSILKGEIVGLLSPKSLILLSWCFKALDSFAVLSCSPNPFLLKSQLEKSKTNLILSSPFIFYVAVLLRSYLALPSPSRSSSSEVVCFFGCIYVISSFRFMPIDRSPEVA